MFKIDVRQMSKEHIDMIAFGLDCENRETFLNIIDLDGDDVSMESALKLAVTLHKINNKMLLISLEDKDENITDILKTSLIFNQTLIDGLKKKQS